jgi:hypothetical protein
MSSPLAVHVTALQKRISQHEHLFLFPRVYRYSAKSESLARTYHQVRLVREGCSACDAVKTVKTDRPSSRLSVPERHQQMFLSAGPPSLYTGFSGLPVIFVHRRGGRSGDAIGLG